ncbi:MAG: hypothetical protein IJY24_06565 [Clostridia bacterium]|nr:hypothetical protein [Clostridia bacterium]
MKKIISILLLICTLTLCLASCGKTDENKITEEFIISKLSDSEGELDGTLTITNGTSDNVLAFNYVVTGINAEKLMDKNFTKNAVQKVFSNPGSITYGELKVCNAFNATMTVVSIFYEDENFDTDEILSIICDRSAKTYENWTISASVDQTFDSITIKAIHN